VKRETWLPRVEGTVSRQAHADLPEGTYEREVGRDGFFGPTAHLYHRHPPTSWSSIEGPLKPRAFDTTRLEKPTESPWDAAVLLENRQLRYRLWRSTGTMSALARNGDGDELVFVHAGEGHLFCDYGHLTFREGDYLVLPRGTLWRIESPGPVTALLIEATDSAYSLPDRGSLGQHAVFDPGVLETPQLDAAFDAQRGETSWRVVVKARGALSTITYPFNPLDAVGWKGNHTVLKLNWRDIRPVMSARYHVPPSAHTTFLADGFVICTFVPRPVESDPGALKVPFYHSNDDYDEVIFYHQGEFFSRDDIRPGSITLHPSGLTHGPHPKALEKSRTAPRTFADEVAVMLDARGALDVTRTAASVEIESYVNSWKAT